MSNKQLPQEFYTMMEELQTLDFVLVELTLYLDTHPDDYNAITQFNEFSHARRILKNQFEEKFGPLQQFGNSYSDYPWNWNDPPWPWQI
ncbi:spore coat protein JB [Evansella vedderi]|uniref:Spore coat protein JB n=1 Tax=Evansella vedderi TaxID=38282 RepID=A0ABT9ZPG7_9BACI|nr:spore coat protein CotJB [Evansella vedderi]MDQ0252744.1 spore coat protein JB [Evansella vedderi]